MSVPELAGAGAAEIARLRQENERLRAAIQYAIVDGHASTAAMQTLRAAIGNMNEQATRGK